MIVLLFESRHQFGSVGTLKPLAGASKLYFKELRINNRESKLKFNNGCFTTPTAGKQRTLHHCDRRKTTAGKFNQFVRGGAIHVDIACDPKLVKLVTSLTRLPVCVSSVDPSTFLAAVEAGASMVEIGNYDSFYDAGIVFSPEKFL
ncbi:putative dihydropteroate synthase [Helianthus debilis subsp. tardiflorus]